MGRCHLLDHRAGRALRRLLCSLAVLLLLGAGAVQAQITPDPSSDAQSGPPGQPLAQPLRVQFTSTFGTTDVLWRVVVDDTGGATLSHPSDIEVINADEVVLNFTTGVVNGPTLTFGPNPGDVQVEACEATQSTVWGCATAAPVFIFNATALAPALTINKVTLDPIISQVGQTFNVAVQVSDSLGLPVVGENVRFLSNPGIVTPDDTTVVTDGNGNATAVLTAAQAGVFSLALSVSVDPDGVPSTGDEVVVDYNYNFAAAPANLVADTLADNQSGVPGSSLPLALHVSNTGGTATTVLWTVVNDNTNGATLTLASDLDPLPVSGAVAINPSQQAGPILNLGNTAGTVQVATCEAMFDTINNTWVCLSTPFYAFNAMALASNLVKLTADPIAAVVGAPFDVSVELNDALGNGMPGKTIQFSPTPGIMAPANASIVTDASGTATASFSGTQAGSFPTAMIVSADPDGIPASGDELSVTYGFDFTAAAIGSLEKTPVDSGDGQTGLTGSRLTFPLRAQAFDGGGAVEPGVALNWTVLSGDVQLDSGTSTTGNNGVATMGVRLGSSATTSTIRAERSDVPGALQDFTVRAIDLYSLVIVSGDGQQAPVNSAGEPLVVRLNLNGSPVAGEDVQWQVITGDALLEADSSTTDAAGQASIGINLGSTPGNVTVQASIPALDLAPLEFQLTAQPIITVPGATLAIHAGNNQSGLINTRADNPLVVELLDDMGAPIAGQIVEWSLVSGDVTLDGPTSNTDTAGLASIGFDYGTMPGNAVVRASVPSLDVTPVEFQLTVQPVITVPGATLTIHAGDNQSGLVNTRADNPLVVELFDGMGMPVAGQSVTWSIVSGDVTLDGASSNTDAAGLASMGFDYGATPGNAVVQASVPSLGVTPVEFQIVVQPLTTVPGVILAIHAGDHQSGPITTRADNALVVELTDDMGVPLAGRTIDWTVTSGDTSLDDAFSVTDANGLASMGFDFGPEASAETIRASIGDGSIYVDFQANDYLPMLALQSGDGQTGPVSEELTEDFVIAIAPPASPLAKSLQGVAISWHVVDGSGSLSEQNTTTDANGQARTRLRLGPNPGVNTVRAEIAGGPSLIFHATGTVIPTASQLRIVSGDGQQLPTATASQPLVIEAVDSDNQPIEGVVLDWQIDNGTLSDDSTQTDESGRSSNIARVAISGTATVHVILQSNSDVQLVFTLNGGVANILDLDDNERRVAEAVDRLCPALLALDSPTPEQQDLLERCLELVDNAGDHPDEVVSALDEMMQDVALVQVHSALLTASTQFGNIRQRIADLRAGRQSPLSLDGLSLGVGNGTLPLSLLPEAGDNDEVGTDFSRWGFFASGNIGRGDVDAGGARSQYDFNTAGLTAGVDYRISDQWFAGAAFGYARQDNQLGSDQGHVNTRGWSISGYSTWFNANNWYVDGVFTYGRNRYDLMRRIRYQIHSGATLTDIDQTASADSNGDQIYAALSFGRDFQKGAWNFGPYARASWARLGFNAYEERLISSLPGSGLGLSVQPRDIDASSLVLGGKASMASSHSWGVLMPNISLEWEHQLQDDPQFVVAHFLADPTRSQFEIAGESLDSDFYRMGIGLSALWAGGRSGFINYEHLIGASGISQGNLSLGIRIEF